MIDFHLMLSFLDGMSTGFYSEALMLILMLILIEGLLSVDNAMAIAAMASHLPRHQQKKALRWGIIGAYLFRGIVLFMVSWLMSTPWVKWVGASYLVYLAANHLSIKHVENHNRDGGGHSVSRMAGKGLFATIVSIELMDLSLSVDNVIAAVGLVDGAKHIPLEYHIWVVCIGVFIGIIALRIVAGWCIDIMRKYPVLGDTAFLLIGFVGFQMMAEQTMDILFAKGMIDHVYDGGMAFKFSVITFIIVLSLLYSKKKTCYSMLKVPVRIFRYICFYIAQLVHILMWPIKAPFLYLFSQLTNNKHD